MNRYMNPVVGSYIVPDGWQRPGHKSSGIGERLEPSSWNGSDFFMRIPVAGHSVAVNVERTGRTRQYPFGVSDRAYVRVKITYVREDGENQVDRGWMLIEPELSEDFERTIRQWWRDDVVQRVLRHERDQAA